METFAAWWLAIYVVLNMLCTVGLVNRQIDVTPSYAVFSLALQGWNLYLILVLIQAAL